MSESLKSAVRLAVLRLLDPLVKWLLEAGVGVGDFVSLVKLAYVRAARDQGRASGGESNRPNASRISVVTGLTRSRSPIFSLPIRPSPVMIAGASVPNAFFRAGGTIPRSRSQREPAVLPVRGGRRSFAALVERYSGERWRSRDHSG